MKTKPGMDTERLEEFVTMVTQMVDSISKQEKAGNLSEIEAAYRRATWSGFGFLATLLQGYSGVFDSLREYVENAENL